MILESVFWEFVGLSLREDISKLSVLWWKFRFMGSLQDGSAVT